jgi:hypothetical protein
VRAIRRGDLVGDRVHEPQAVSLPHRPGSRGRGGIADLAVQRAGYRAYQQPSRSCAVRDRVRCQLVHRENHIHHPVFRHARNRRASRNPFPQQVQRGSIEALVEYDQPRFSVTVTAGHLPGLPADGRGIRACSPKLRSPARARGTGQLFRKVRESNLEP